MNPYEDLTDDEFKEQVLDPVIAEAKRRKFTLKLDPFGVLPKRDPAPRYPQWRIDAYRKEQERASRERREAARNRKACDNRQGDAVFENARREALAFGFDWNAEVHNETTSA